MQSIPISQWTPLPWFLVSPPYVSPQISYRPRIAGLFDEAVSQFPLTLVAAHSGFSKTTSLASWAARTRHVVAWLTLTGSNGGDAVFLNGIVSALHRIIPEVPEQDVALVSGLLPDATDEAKTLERIVALSAALHHPLVVVIDDVQLGGEELVSRMIGLLGLHCTDKIRFVLAGDPVLVGWFIRDLAEGRAVRVGPDELALTQAELEIEVAARPGTEDPQAEVESLHEDTGGWPIAVHLARLGTVPRPVAARHDGEILTAYVASSVLGSLRPELVEFILTATTCQRISVAMAEALTQNPHSGALLEECATQGIFLDRLVDEDNETIYSWHYAFAKQCRILFGRTDSAGQRLANLNAARFLESVFPSEAMVHALRATDHGEAVQIMRRSWLRIIIEFGAGVMNSLCLKLDAESQASFEVLLVRACCLDSMGDATGSALLQAKAAEISRGTDLTHEERKTWAFGELFFEHDAGRLGEAVDLARKYIGGEKSNARSYAYQLFFIGWTELRLRRDPAEAVRLLRSALYEAENAGMENLVQRARANLMLALAFGGNFTAARALMDRYPGELDSTANSGWNHYDGGIEPFARGLTDYWQNRLPEAKEQFSRMIERGGHATSYTALARVFFAFCAAASADTREIREAEQHLAGIAQYEEHGVPWQAYSLLALASLQSAAGDSTAACATLEGLHTTANVPVLLAMGAEIHRRAGNTNEAMAFLGGIPKSGAASYVAVSALLTSAMMARERGEREEAHHQLEKALDIATGQSIGRPFAGADEALAGLLTEHAAWGTAHEGFLAARIAHSEAGISRHSLLGAMLTSREKEIFGYLCTTMTAEEIAAELYVSVNTVRTHQRSIYRKLGVSTRREAIKYTL